LPEIKKEISRKGSPKPAEKVLQIREEKIQNQAANEKALPRSYRRRAFVIIGDAWQGYHPRGREGAQSYPKGEKDAGLFSFTV
jgi:hypothetical protein